MLLSWSASLHVLVSYLLPSCFYFHDYSYLECCSCFCARLYYTGMYYSFDILYHAFSSTLLMYPWIRLLFIFSWVYKLGFVNMSLCCLVPLLSCSCWSLLIYPCIILLFFISMDVWAWVCHHELVLSCILIILLMIDSCLCTHVLDCWSLSPWVYEFGLVIKSWYWFDTFIILLLLILAYVSMY